MDFSNNRPCKRDLTNIGKGTTGSNNDIISELFTVGEKEKIF